MKELSRILIVGLGSIGKRHLRIAKKLFPEVEVGVLRHRKVNGPVEDGVDHLFYTYDDAVSFKPDIAVIANPATHHLSIAQQLGEAGVNMLIEKPLAESSDGVSQLIKQCDRNKVKLAVGYNLRYLPSLNEFKNLIEKGIIGDIWSVKSEIGQYLPSWRPDSDYRHCVSAKKSLGGGVLLELSHELDYMQWVFGEPRWVLASLTKQSNLEIDVEDNAHIIMEMNDSLTNRSAVVTVNMDFIRHDTTRTCTVIGEFGTMRCG